MPNTQENLHLLYKKVGETPLLCIERFKKENPQYADVPMTYAGRLDPMAEGLLLALSGEAVHEKEKYLGLQKTYVCQMLWGFETDTLDILGKVEKKYPVSSVKEEKIKEELVKSVGKFEQKYPAYSSKPVKGIPLFTWAREGKLDEIEIPTHEVELTEAKFTSRKIISGEVLLQYIVAKVSLVQGDFRQKEILEKWEEELSKCLFDSFVVDTVELQVSSGFYVRQFISDFSAKFGQFATTFHIKREKIGKFILTSVDN